MKKIIVNGTFDILHQGHIRMLNTARSLGDYLLVCIDTDRRVKELKGENRPIVNQYDRKYHLEQLRSVDQVLMFDSQEELIEIIQIFKPDIMVKGSDYKGRSVIGETYVPEVIYYERLGEYSTTKTLQTIIDRR